METKTTFAARNIDSVGIFDCSNRRHRSIALLLLDNFGDRRRIGFKSAGINIGAKIAGIKTSRAIFTMGMPLIVESNSEDGIDNN